MVSDEVLPSATEGGIFDVRSLSQGDFDIDGDVDAADYSIWRSSYGAAGEPFAEADGNGNGVVDAGDYVIWRNSFQDGEMNLKVPVPEPNSSTLIGIAIWSSLLKLGAYRAMRP
jgi:hypothetical protein